MPVHTKALLSHSENPAMIFIVHPKMVGTAQLFRLLVLLPTRQQQVGFQQGPLKSVERRLQ
jgi:hypothetical protein